MGARALEIAGLLALQLPRPADQAWFMLFAWVYESPPKVRVPKTWNIASGESKVSFDFSTVERQEEETDSPSFPAAGPEGSGRVR